MTVNLAFTFRGLLALEVPTRTLRGMPDEFIDGMAARAPSSATTRRRTISDDWDPVWGAKSRGKDVHILVMLNAADAGRMAARCPSLPRPAPRSRALCERLGGVALLTGHKGPDPAWQTSRGAARRQRLPCPKEHFGFTDGISDPVFQGQYAKGEEQARSVGYRRDRRPRQLAADRRRRIPARLAGRGAGGARRRRCRWISAATAPSSPIASSTRTSTGFNNWVDETSRQLQAVWKLGSFDEARETLLAKMAGRWSDGVPLKVAPTYGEWHDFNAATRPRRTTASATTASANA